MECKKSGSCFQDVSSHLTLVLHFLCGPPNDVDVGRWQPDGGVHRDVLGGAVRREDPHVGLIERGPRLSETSAII